VDYVICDIVEISEDGSPTLEKIDLRSQKVREQNRSLLQKARNLGISIVDEKWVYECAYSGEIAPLKTSHPRMTDELGILDQIVLFIPVTINDAEKVR
jgi:hypothetical protein